MDRRKLLLLPLFAILLVPRPPCRAETFVLRAVDKQTQQPLPVRVHLKNKRGRTVRPRNTVFWKDHFVFDGEIELDVRPGEYSFEMERGPEYRVHYGGFHLERGAEGEHTFEMERFVNMKEEGWWSGDLHIHRPPEQIELLMRAEDLHIGPVITWWNQRNLWSQRDIPDSLLVRFDENRFYRLMAGEDERGGGALLYFNLQTPLPISAAEREYPSSVQFLNLASKQPGAHIDAEKPFWWDVPAWIASGQVDSIGLANNHMQRDGMLANEAWGKPRDTTRYPGPHGNGRWSQDLYYRLLECGLRIPPSAGSASGVLANPVGYNRVYVYCGAELTWEKWWAGLRAGQVVVGNGPLLRPRVNGHLPGHVFTAQDGQPVELNLTLEFAQRQPADYLEIVKNGRVLHAIELAKLVNQQGRLPKVTFQKSGWLLMRVITNHEKTFRFGSTGPYYVEIGGQPRISRSAAQFFLDWVYERARQFQLEDARQQEAVLRYHRAARDFWKDLVDRANAD